MAENNLPFRRYVRIDVGDSSCGCGPGVGSGDASAAAQRANVSAGQAAAAATEAQGAATVALQARDEAIAAAGTALQPGDVGSAAFANTDAFATAAQGVLAETALQSADLGSAAFQSADAFATAGQGALAATALQPDVVGSAAFQPSSAFATAGQGALAATALQPGAADTQTQFLQAGAGAAARSTRSKLRESFSVTDFAVSGDGVADDTAGITAAVTEGQTTGAKVKLPAGAYRVFRTGLPGIEIDSPIVGEPDADRRAVALRGDGAGNTVIVSGEAGQYAVKLTGGDSVDAHGHEDHGDFSIVAGVSGSNGLHVFNKALTSVENVTLQGHNTGLKLESTLSSRFANLTAGNNAVYGAHMLKGDGFSGVNANTFDSCNFRSNGVLGVHCDEFVTDLVFVGCNFENNGRHGFPSEGGASLVFNGSEGRSGATFIGGYFESNAGGADLFLHNAGSEYVTVVLTGVTFNRNIADRFVTNCIRTSGKIVLVLRGCAFASYNGYVPDAGRPYVSGDSLLILNHDGCVFADAVEAPTELSQTARLSYAGNVQSDGSEGQVPAGWSTSQLSAGNYRVTHSLGFSDVSQYAVSVVGNSGAAAFPLTVTKGANVFDVAMVGPGFGSVDASFDFTLTRA